jgi:hypothetical protein
MVFGFHLMIVVIVRAVQVVTVPRLLRLLQVPIPPIRLTLDRIQVLAPIVQDVTDLGIVVIEVVVVPVDIVPDLHVGTLVILFAMLVATGLWCISIKR